MTANKDINRLEKEVLLEIVQYDQMWTEANEKGELVLRMSRRVKRLAAGDRMKELKPILSRIGQAGFILFEFRYVFKGRLVYEATELHSADAGYQLREPVMLIAE